MKKNSLVALLTLFAMLPVAHALAIDAKGLARFDISYVKCETYYPDLRGQRDDAYLAMWRLKPTDKLRADLATARRSGIYQAERRRTLDAIGKKAMPAASSPVDQQCQALRNETRRVRGSGKS